jgi:hypothetical protein
MVMPPHKTQIGHLGISFLLFLLANTRYQWPEKKQESPTQVRRNLDFIGAVDRNPAAALRSRRGTIQDHAGAGLL